MTPPQNCPMGLPPSFSTTGRNARLPLGVVGRRWSPLLAHQDLLLMLIDGRARSIRIKWSVKGNPSSWDSFGL